MPIPGINPGAGGEVGAGLERLGAGVETLGAGIQREQYVQAARQKAQDVLASEGGLNIYTPRLDTFFAEQRRTSDYAQVPALIEQHHKELLDEVSQGMSPGAAQLFRQKAGERFRTVNREALHFTDTRLAEDGPIKIKDTTDTYIRSMLRAQTPEDTSQLTVSYLASLQDFATVGLAHRESIGPLFRAAQETIEVEQVKLRIQRDPQATFSQLRLGPEANPDVPIVAYDDLLKQAGDTLYTNFLRQEGLARAGQHAVTQAQEETYTKLNVALTAATIDQVPDLLARASQLAVQRGLSKEQYDLFRNNAFAHQARLRNPTPTVIDDPKIEDVYRRLLAQPGKTGREIEDLQQALTAEQRLSGSTVQTMQADLARQRDTTYYMNRKIYGEGKDYIELAILPQINKIVSRLVGTVPAKEDAAQVLSLALGAYRRRLSQLWQENPPEVFDELAFSTAREVVATFGQLQGLALRDLPHTVVVSGEDQNALSPSFQALAQKYQTYYQTLAGRQDLGPAEKVREFDILGQREFVERLIVLQSGKAHAPTVPQPSGAQATPVAPPFQPGGTAPRR